MIRFYAIILMFLLVNIHAIIGQERDITESFEEIFDGLFDSMEPGGSVLVMKSDEVVFQGNYGLADLVSKEAITENTVFNTGSISKTFVANAILILQERGLLSVNDPISKYFDDFEHQEISEGVTIEHLLSHTSGLPDIRDVRRKSEYFLTAKDKGNWDPIKKTSKLNFDPGSRFEYSNPAFNGLALIIEQVSGQKWQDFINKEIFNVAEMDNSTITDGAHPESGVAHGYNPSGDEFMEADYGEIPTFAAAGNGGVWSSVMELALYEKAIRNAVFLSTETIARSRTPFHPSQWGSTNPPKIGYSWFLDDGSSFGLPAGKLDIVYHTGSQGGFRAFYISIPEKEILYVGLFNRPFNDYREVMEEGLQVLHSADWLEE